MGDHRDIVPWPWWEKAILWAVIIFALLAFVLWAIDVLSTWPA